MILELLTLVAYRLKTETVVGIRRPLNSLLLDIVVAEWKHFNSFDLAVGLST